MLRGSCVGAGMVGELSEGVNTDDAVLSGLMKISGASVGPGEGIGLSEKAVNGGLTRFPELNFGPRVGLKLVCTKECGVMGCCTAGFGEELVV